MAVPVKYSRGAALRCFSLARGKQREWRPRHRLRTVRSQTQGPHFTTRLGNGYRDGVRVDIETDKSYFTHETDSPFFACGSVLLAQRNPRIRETGGRSFNFAWNMDRPGSRPFGHDD